MNGWRWRKSERRRKRKRMGKGEREEYTAVGLLVGRRRGYRREHQWHWRLVGEVMLGEGKLG